MRRALHLGCLLVSIASAARGQVPPAPPQPPAAAEVRDQDAPPPPAQAVVVSRRELADFGYYYYLRIFGPAYASPMARTSPLSATKDVFDAATKDVFDAARANALRRLSLQFDDVERIAPLTEAQKKKLQAAGERDIQQFFDRAEQVKRDFLSGVDNAVSWRKLELSQTRLALEFDTSLFGEESLFSKVAASTLEEPNAGRWRESREDRARAYVKTRALLMAQSLGNAVGLSDDQRRKLSALIVAEIAPPSRSVPMDYYFLLYKLDQLPRDKIRTIFDDAQWQALSHQLVEQFAANVKETLIRMGYEPDDLEPTIPEPAK